MTELEYLIKNKTEVIKEALVGDGIAKVNGEIRTCKATYCTHCDFKLNEDCRDATRKWLDEEHIEKPLPCPFCGSENIEVSETAYYVECNDCGVETRCYHTIEEALEAWNRRV